MQTISRLIGALEVMTDQAIGLVHLGDYPSALALQTRCQPLVDEISRLMVIPGLGRMIESETRARALALVHKQGVQLAEMAAAQAAASDQLKILLLAQSRTHRFRTAYGHPSGSSPTHQYAESG